MLWSETAGGVDNRSSEQGRRVRSLASTKFTGSASRLIFRPGLRPLTSFSEV